MEGDIRGCFDYINHEWMLRHLPTDKEVLRKWLKAGYVEKGRLFETRAGTPQGGIISPILANLTLDGLETLLTATFKRRNSRGGRYDNPKVALVRYADDFIVTGASKDLLENEVRPVVERFLRERGLELSPEKTCVTSTEEGFDFLGQKNVQVFLAKVRQLIRESYGQSQMQLVRQLNPLVRGWANYHRHIVATRTFEHVAKVLFESLWRWAMRRHSNQSRAWIKKRYWHRLEGTNVFAVRLQTASGEKPEWVRLVDPGRIKIRRHVKVRAAANPFDPAWRDYFEGRKAFRGSASTGPKAAVKPSD